MIRAAIEVGGAAVILVACAVGALYGLYAWRHEKRRLDREEAREQREFDAEQKS